MKNIITGVLLLLFCLNTFAQEDFREKELLINEFTDGTLTTPTKQETSSMVLFIQGSGPTDRDGNQPMMKSNFAQKIARELARQGIASYRFDKRIFKMDQLNMQEKDLRFEHFVEDVEAILRYFNSEEDFSNIIVAGHSEGSLIGMLAAKNNADAFISLAGAGQGIDNIIVEQIGKQAPGLKENTRTALDELKETGSTTSYNPALESIFRPSVQPYMESWMKYDPAEKIAELDMPVLIINGTADLQVEVTEAQRLKEAKPDAQLVIIEDMNHVFREIEDDDDLTNAKSYNEPGRPLHPQLIPAMVEFIENTEEKTNE